VQLDLNVVGVEDGLGDLLAQEPRMTLAQAVDQRFNSGQPNVERLRCRFVGQAGPGSFIPQEPFGLATGRFLGGTKSLALPLSPSIQGDSVWWTIQSQGAENDATANCFMPAHRFQLRGETSEQNYCTGRRTANGRAL
jgi:hypothetical protein